jgi:Mn2+/Fe2+ NRAMP family transporter
MQQLALMVIVAVALHLLLGWPLLAGIVITAAVLTIPGLIKLFAQVNDENRTAVFGIALQVIGEL